MKGASMAHRPPNQHVVHRPNGWAVVGEGNKRATTVQPTQHEAIDRAREIARNNQSQVVIHDRGNKIRDVDSYGPDPCPPKDSKH